MTNERKEKNPLLPDKIKPIDFNQTIKYRLVQRYGDKIGKKIVKCIQDSLFTLGEGEPVDTEELIAEIKKQCIDLIKESPGDIEIGNLENILILCAFWSTVG